jgi:hypothetical protein
MYVATSRANMCETRRRARTLDIKRISLRESAAMFTDLP